MNPFQRRPFLAWPGWPHLRFAGMLTLVVAVWFGLVYVGADSFTTQRTLRVRVHLEAELRFPLTASFTLIYLSLYALFAAAPFVLRTWRELNALALALALTIAIAGVCFLLLPAQLAYAPPTDAELGAWKPLFGLADKLNLDYNLVPSLHVALSFVCIEFFATHATTSGRILLRSWGWLIAASTLLTHQHHLLDAATGWLLAIAVVKLVRRIEKPFPSSEKSTPSGRYSA